MGGKRRPESGRHFKCQLLVWARFGGRNLASNSRPESGTGPRQNLGPRASDFLTLRPVFSALPPALFCMVSSGSRMPVGN